MAEKQTEELVSDALSIDAGGRLRELRQRIGLSMRALARESGGSSGPFGMTQTSHEFVICMRGQLEYPLENEHYVLELGDSLLFAANMRHRWRNPGKIVTRAMFVLSGLEEHEHPSEFHISSGLHSEDEDGEDFEELGFLESLKIDIIGFGNEKRVPNLAPVCFV